MHLVSTDPHRVPFFLNRYYLFLINIIMPCLFLREIKKTNSSAHLPLLSNVTIVDRVFQCDSTTKQVYEEAAKEVALSVVGGINCEYVILYFYLFRCCGFCWKSINWIICKWTEINTKCFFSKHFCLWANKQWKNVHHEWNNRVHISRYIQLYTEGE